MNPGHVDELYTAYLEETLKPAERERVEQHLRTCASCTAALAEIRQLHADLRALPVLPLPAGFTVGVRECLRLQQPARQPFIFSWRIAAFAGTLAAAALFALVLLPGKDAPSNITAPGNTRTSAVASHTPEASATVATVAALPVEQPTVEPVAKPPKPTKTFTIKAIHLPPKEVVEEQRPIWGRSSDFDTGRKLVIDEPRAATHYIGTFVCSGATDVLFDTYGAPGNGGSNLSNDEPVIPEVKLYTLPRTASINLNPTGPAAPFGAASPGITRYEVYAPGDKNRDDGENNTSTAPNISETTTATLPITIGISRAAGPEGNQGPWGVSGRDGMSGSLGTTSLSRTDNLGWDPTPATFAVKTFNGKTGAVVAQSLQDDGKLYASAVIPGAGSNVILEMQGGRVNTVTATALDATTSKEGERLDVKIDPTNSQRVNLNIADSEAPAAVKLAFNNNQKADKFYLFVPGKSQRANFVQNRADQLNVRNATQDFHGGKPIVSNMAQMAQESGMYILCPADFAEKSVTQINDAPALEQLRFLADNLNYRMSVNNQLCNITPVP